MRTRPIHSTLFAILAALALFLSACGDDGDSSTEASGDDGGTADSADDSSSDDSASDDSASDDSASDDSASGDGGDGDLEDAIDGMVEGLEDLQESQGGGSATLRVGDQEWTFSPVLCAFGEEEIGQEGAEFVLSSIQDGMQMYASIDSFGHSVSLDDVSDFENPSVGLSAFGDITIAVDGKNISAEGEFRDSTTDSFDSIPGTFSATCP